MDSTFKNQILEGIPSKIPAKKEIEKALKIKEEYYASKS